MTESDKGQLLMLCGALNDIAERTHDKATMVQIQIVQSKIEEIVLKYLPII